MAPVVVLAVPQAVPALWAEEQVEGPPAAVQPRRVRPVRVARVEEALVERPGEVRVGVPEEQPAERVGPVAVSKLQPLATHFR